MSNDLSSDTETFARLTEEPPAAVEDREEMLRALRLMVEPGRVVELRCLEVSGEPGSWGSYARTYSGYFDDLEALADEAMRIGPYAHGVYVTLNPVNQALLARANNHLKAASGRDAASTADHDIVARRLLLIDADPKRPAGISSSDAEHQAALQRAEAIADFLLEQGWFSPIVADSGNGGHLLYWIDLPADDGGLVKQVLEALAAMFSDDVVDVDVKVFNPARISKLYGSVARKGEDIAGRPHRLAHILDAPMHPKPIPRHLLEALVAKLAPPAKESQPRPRSPQHQQQQQQQQQAWSQTRREDKHEDDDGRHYHGDLGAWIAAHDLDVREPRPYTDANREQGRKWVFNVCPFNEAHTNGSAVLMQLGNGAVSFMCQHNGCASNNWHALRTLLGDGPPRWDDEDGDDEGDAGTNAEAAASDPLMPPGYLATAKGLMKVSTGDDGKRTRKVIAHAQDLRITSRIVDVTDNTHALRLSWQLGGRWHETVAQRKDVMNARDLVNLANVGFPVTSLNERELTAYLDAYEHHNRDRLPVERVSARLGWHDNHACFLWGNEPLSVDTPTEAEEKANAQAPRLRFRAASSGDAQLADACRSAGTLDEWIAAVAPIRAYPTVQFALYAALTAPLLRVLDVPNFIVDFSGRTSTGKTTALRVAASVAGNPDERASASLVSSWDTTRVAIERRCATSTDLPVFLDDTKWAKRAEEVGTILYEVANGKGRDRGNLAGRDRTSSWHTVVLSTGEAPATSFTQDGGTHGRVLAFNGLPFTRGGVAGDGAGAGDGGLEATAGLVEHLGSGVRRHYGHTLPLLVRFVQAHRTEWPQWQEAYLTLRDTLHATNEVACRLTAYFAAVQFTATLTHWAFAEAGHPLPWEPDLSGLWGAIAASTDEANTDVRALQEVFPWAASHEKDFYRPDTVNVKGKVGVYEPLGADAPRTGWLGRWPRGANWAEMAFLPDKLRGFLEGAGFRYQEVYNGWKERGWLRLDPDGKPPKVRLTSETRPRLVVVLRHAFVAVGAVDANAWDRLWATDEGQAADDAALVRLEERGVAMRIPPLGHRVSRSQLKRLLDLDYAWEEAVRLTEGQARTRLAKGKFFRPVAVADDADGELMAVPWDDYADADNAADAA